MRNPFRQPRVQSRPLSDICDEYIALMGPYDRSDREVWALKCRLAKLMHKHRIDYIARKDTLLKLAWICSWPPTSIELLPLDRLGPDVFSENTKAAHLIPLVDRLLEADGSHGRNKAEREKLETSLARAAKAEGQSESFVYQGYRFRWYYYSSSKSGSLIVNRITDFDG